MENRLFIYLFIFYFFIYLFVCLLGYLFGCLLVYLFAYLFIYLYVYLFVYLNVCLLCSGACDSIIFMFLGLALVRDDHVWNTGFILWSAFLCLAVRFLGQNPFALSVSSESLLFKNDLSLNKQIL